MRTPRVVALAAATLALCAAPAGARVSFPEARGIVQSATSLVSGAALGNSHVLVGLRLRNEGELDRLIDEVSDPHSARYRHYLSPAQFRARFSPAQDDVDALKAFAKRYGLRATTPRNRLWVEMSGLAVNASRAFDAALRAYRRADGTNVVAPSRAPSVPEALRGIVTGIEGLNTSSIMHPAATTSPPARSTAGPCSAYWGERMSGPIPAYNGATSLPMVPCGYTPKQLQGAYGLTSAIAAGVDGRGVRVGIIDAWGSSTMREDVNTWSAKHGLPPADVTDITGPLPANFPEIPLGSLDLIDPQGWASEETLDVEAVHAMAPGASIIYSGALTPLNVAFTQAQNDMVDNARAQIVSNSYGGATDDADANTDALLKQAAAQGIGFYFSTGDEGDETKDPNGPGDREANTSANNPLATAVGGTSLAVTKDDGYGFETGWGTWGSTLTDGAWQPAPPGEFVYGGGGGTSQSYAQPDYQRGVVPASIANYFEGKPAEKSQGNGFAPKIPGRAEPDIAMDGDPNTGMTIGLTQNFSSGDRNGLQLPGDEIHYSEFRLGGTSLSSPLFAGVMALADQAAGKPHGFVNPALYDAYRANESMVRDVVDPAKPVAAVRIDYTNMRDASAGTKTLLRLFNATNTLHTIPGYDDVTGLGSPNGLFFLHAMAPGSKILPPLPTPAPVCKRVKSLTFKLKAPKGKRIVRVVVRLGTTGKAHIVRGKSVRSVRVTMPAKRRRLEITSYASNGKRLKKTTRYVSPCGVVK